MSWSTSELRVRLAPLNRFKPSSKIFYWPFQGGTSFVDLLCFCSVWCLLCLCASFYMCFVVSCWERADLLALVCGVFCEFFTFPLVSWVRCGTWLYRFLIFAPLLTLRFYGILHKNWQCWSDAIIPRSAKYLHLSCIFSPCHGAWGLSNSLISSHFTSHKTILILCDKHISVNFSGYCHLIWQATD